MSRDEWKAYAKSTDDHGCRCGGRFAAVSFAGAGALLAVMIAVYAHCECVVCSHNATPEPGRERTLLWLIRIVAVAACVTLAVLAYRAAVELRSHPELPVLTPRP